MDRSDQHRSYLQEGIHECVGLVVGDGESKTRSTIEDLAATALTLAAAGVLRGKGGYALSAAVSALNQTEVGEPVNRQFEDAAIGAFKGLAFKGIYERTLGQGSTRFLQGWPAYISGVAGLDLALRRQNISDLGRAANDAPKTTTASPADVSGFHAGQYVPKFQAPAGTGSDATTGGALQAPEAAAVAPQPPSQPLDHQAEVDRMLSFGTPLDRLAGTIGANNTASINYRNWQPRH